MRFVYEINGWSFTKEQMNELCKTLVKYKPKSICEFGCGVTSSVFKQWCENNDCELLSIEHDAKYAKMYNGVLFPLKAFGELEIGDIHFNNVNYYVGLEEYLNERGSKFDFVCIDGPFGGDKRYEYTRVQLLDFIEYDLLCDECVFMVHDVERASQEKTLNIFEKMLKDKGYEFSKEEINNGKILRVYKISKSKKPL
jgi:hypothetical protein